MIISYTTETIVRQHGKSAIQVKNVTPQYSAEQRTAIKKSIQTQLYTIFSPFFGAKVEKLAQPRYTGAVNDSVPDCEERSEN